MIQREQEANILQWIDEGKAIVLIGPRQVGKATLMKRIGKVLDRRTLWLSGDDPQVRSQSEGITTARLKRIIGSHEVVIIDEAQRIQNTGMTLKLITDHITGIQLFVTGSSSLDLASQTKESLVGRKFEHLLLPISFKEMVGHHGYLRERGLLEHRLIYGYYPEIVNSEVVTAVMILNDLTDGLMYKDLLTLDQVKMPSLVVKLLTALALQLGNEVSYNELAQLTGADPVTVERYVDLLEKTFVVFRLPSLSRNARNEIKRGKKIYFYDVGIRNAIIKNFNPLN